ncbi:acetyl esterase/lipase [Jatrophihabitans sp. GAS493]|uniref:alpha/beta hydrolase family protein n=1 Tax=Jatrophihabitans sp. GAS493 TaxID=1907575 RepID=UPI000BB93191|nr:alpha/beta hydrolase [Jatrophihabitans sp. GAS493]SOD74704.1 acetyl esterase/lipase [Jatrophihabitans sp. GAS493]
MSAATPTAVSKHSYGDEPSQFGELYLPAGERRPGTVVVIHGGFWRSRYNLGLGRPLALDLAARGWAAWNLEYRRVGGGTGGGGGWPQTFDDVAAGIDRLADLAGEFQLDLSRVAAVGHSAGGHLAVWAAGRATLPAGVPGAQPRVQVTAAVAQAGVLCLAEAAGSVVGDGAVLDLLGGTPEEVPQRYAVADPVQLLPTGARVLCVHGHGDDDVPFQQSEHYVRAARQAGDEATLADLAGGHMELIDVSDPAWQTVLDALPELLS